MMKFFRKYNKQMMAGLMVLLMVVFIGGSALQGLLTPNVDRLWGESKYGPVRESDIQYARRQTELLEAIGRDWTMPLSSGGQLEVVDWLLLGREAKAMGIGANVSAVRGTAGSPGEQIDLVAHRLRVKPAVIYEALAEYKAVQDATLAIGAAALPSEAEVRTAARDSLEKVKVRTVVIPAQAYVDENAQFSDVEMQAHFDKYREKERGEGLSFGYFIPPKIKVQYVEINRDVINEHITLPNADRKAREFYDQNKTTNPAFRRNPDEIAQKKLEAEAAANPEDGAPPPEPDPFLTWEEAKPVALTLAKKRHADEAAAQLAGWMIQYADEPWFDVSRAKTGYKAAPQAARDEAFYQRMLEHVPSTLSFPGAVSVKVTDAFSPDTVTTLPGIGMATFDSENAAPRMFPALVFKNEALVPEIPENTGPGGDSYLAVYQTSRVPVRNAQTGNYYVFRVVGSEAAHAPASLPEVRDQVLADMRSAKGFETAKQRAQAIRNALGTQPLQTAADADAELSKLKESNTSVPAGYYEPEPFPRVSRYQVANGRPPQGIYAGVGIGRLPNHVVDSIFQLAESEAKADVFELPERNVVLVVEAVELVRAPEDEINPLKDELEGQLAEARWREAVASWLDRKQLHARTGFSFATN